jgi:hypothetical protein
LICRRNAGRFLRKHVKVTAATRGATKSENRVSAIYSTSAVHPRASFPKFCG